MLTSLYYPKEILKSLLSGVPTSLPGGFNSCSFFMGLIGKWADHVNLPVAVISEAFGVTPQAVYGNINRLAQLEAKIEAQSDIPADCIILTQKDMGKICLSLALDAHASLEGIQRVLATLDCKNTKRYIGHISEFLSKAGAFAAEITKTIPLDGICHGANDEVFDGSDKPVLTGVDPDSTYIYLMQNMDDRKGKTWELAMETLKDLGLKLKVAISDAGSGLLKGVKAAFPDADTQLDLFHVLRDIGRPVYRFKEHTFKELAECYKLESAATKEKRQWSQRARKRQKKLADYKTAIPAMIEDFDILDILYSWLHEMVSFSGYSYDEAMELMDWILDEMLAVSIRHSWSYKLSSEILRFKDRLPTIMLFISRLFRDFSMKAEAMGLPEEVFRLLYSRFTVSKESEAYAKLNQQASALIPAGELANVEKVHDEIVTGIKRASSMVENVNGRLRAYMNIKRHVSSNFYSLVQLHMNAKKYRRSRVASRKGHSPLELLTGKPWPEFIDLLEEYGFWDKDMAEQVA